MPKFTGGQIVNGHYEVVTFLAEGGMGYVYEARDTHDGSRVALKCPQDLSLAMRERFMAEIKRTAKVDSVPHVLRLRDFFNQGDELVIVYDLAVGGSLFDRIGRDGARSDKVAFAWLPEIAGALTSIHEHATAKTVHCDVKPGNILFDGAGRALLADFGIAMAMTKAHGGVKTVPLKDRKGSPNYSAPELKAGSPQSASDQYSLAMTAGAVLLGGEPKDAEHLFREARITGDVRRVLTRALLQDPQARFGSCTEFAVAFLEALDRRPGVTKPLGNFDVRPSRFTRATTIAGAVVLVSIGLSTWALLRAASAEEAARRLPDSPASLAHMQEEIKELRQRGMNLEGDLRAVRDLRASDPGAALLAKELERRLAALEKRETRDPDPGTVAAAREVDRRLAALEEKRTQQPADPRVGELATRVTAIREQLDTLAKGSGAEGEKALDPIARRVASLEEDVKQAAAEATRNAGDIATLRKLTGELPKKEDLERQRALLDGQARLLASVSEKCDALKGAQGKPVIVLNRKAKEVAQVTVGVASPEDPGSGYLSLRDETGKEKVVIQSDKNMEGLLQLRNRKDVRALRLSMGDDGDGYLELYDVNGKARVVAGTAKDGNGAVWVTDAKGTQVTLKAGGDVAEAFLAVDVPPAGSVVSLCGDGICVSECRCFADPRAVGIMSGAGSLQPSLVLNHRLDERSIAVALAGQVYCRADVSTGPIRAGDLLTSSNQAGCACKAPEGTSAACVLGKALEDLTEGTRLIRVLVR